LKRGRRNENCLKGDFFFFVVMALLSLMSGQQVSSVSRSPETRSLLIFEEYKVAENLKVDDQ
jgi:hypothetical protein